MGQNMEHIVSGIDVFHFPVISGQSAPRLDANKRGFARRRMPNAEIRHIGILQRNSTLALV